MQEMRMQEAYVSPFSSRYAGPAMQALFSPMHRARLFRRLWHLLARKQAELGLGISQAQLDELAGYIEDIDLARVDAHEKRLRHDVMAHVTAFAEDCPQAAPIIHLGATSCYVTDNADIWILRDAMTLLRDRLVGTARRLAAFAREHKDLPVLAFTHFQPAQPTTLGKRAALWLQDVLEDIGKPSASSIPCAPGLQGRHGTQASFLELFGGQTQGQAAG